ncbi:MAG: hypothetical protein JWN72_316, partial [Thermoleophilia bacterium]|nr:hypothetical protein [Thermoleophilia bacterium]
KDWYHCTLTCVLDEELSTPGCVPMYRSNFDSPFYDRETHPLQELACAPGTGPTPVDDRSATQQLEGLVCGTVLTGQGQQFDYDSWCAEQMERAASDCQNGTRTLYCDKLAPGAGVTNVQTEGATPGSGAAVGTQQLNATDVPGGSTASTCQDLIHEIASGGGASGSGLDPASCLGTSDSSCWSMRARIADGRPLQLSADDKRRCFS